MPYLQYQRERVVLAVLMRAVTTGLPGLICTTCNLRNWVQGAGYDEEAAHACEKALRTLLVKIGPWGGRVFLIGGLVPHYLIGKAPSDMKEHVGTTDLDIVVGVAISTEEQEVYRTLQSNLKEAGFAPTRNPETGQEQSFRWSRNVDGIEVLLEFFCPVGEGQPGTILRNPGDGVGSKIGAIRTSGAELAALDSFAVQLDGETLDHGGLREGVSGDKTEG